MELSVPTPTEIIINCSSKIYLERCLETPFDNTVMVFFILFFTILKKEFYFIFFCFLFFVPSRCYCKGFSLVVETGGYSGCARASHCDGFSCCRARALGHVGSAAGCLGSRAQAQQLWGVGLVAAQHVESSETRDQTHVSCNARQIPYH